MLNVLFRDLEFFRHRLSFLDKVVQAKVSALHSPEFIFNFNYSVIMQINLKDIFYGSILTVFVLFSEFFHAYLVKFSGHGCTSQSI